MTEILDKKYVCVRKDDKVRLYSIICLKPKKMYSSVYNEISSADILVAYKKAIGFFEGIHKAGIPVHYLVSISPRPQPVFNKVMELIKGDEKESEPMFEQSIYAITWIDGKASRIEMLKAQVEERCKILSTALSVGYENFVPENVRGTELEHFIKSITVPGYELEGVENVKSAQLPFALAYSPSLPTQSSEENIPQFYIPNFDESGSEGIYLGRVMSREGCLHKFYLKGEDILQHLCVVGMTGSGKSTTCKVILSQLIKMGVKVMVLDWHNEYGSFFKNIGCNVVSAGKDDSFTLNPLDAINVKDIYEHIALITDIFAEVYRFTSPQTFTFRNALVNLYGDKPKTFSRAPILSNLVDYIEQNPARSMYDNETKTAILRRLLPLTQGQAGNLLNGENTFSMQTLLSENVCIELGHLRDFETRIIFSSILLKMIYDFRLLSGPSKLEHVTVIEEARSIVPARRTEDPPSIGEKMVSELRKFGERMIFVAQYPTQISSEIIKNCGLRIVHRVSWMEDIRILKETLGLKSEQADFLSLLKTGEAVVSVGRIRSPFLVQVDASVVGVGEESAQVTPIGDKL